MLHTTRQVHRIGPDKLELGANPMVRIILFQTTAYLNFTDHTACRSSKLTPSSSIALTSVVMFVTDSGQVFAMDTSICELKFI